jgi:hypothetical protein
LVKFGALLFKGERNLRARCRFVSSAGQGKVDVESVELDGQRLPDFLVDWLIASTVHEHLPDFEAGKPFSLGYRLRQIRLEPAQVVFVAE